MEDDFTNHKHLVWFKDVDEGFDLVRYYLDHDEERERIGAEGRKIAMRGYTFERRLMDFEKYVKDFGL